MEHDIGVWSHHQFCMYSNGQIFRFYKLYVFYQEYFINYSITECKKNFYLEIKMAKINLLPLYIR